MICLISSMRGESNRSIRDSRDKTDKEVVPGKEMTFNWPRRPNKENGAKFTSHNHIF